MRRPELAGFNVASFRGLGQRQEPLGLGALNGLSELIPRISPR
jgi:hypothetical protein